MDSHTLVRLQELAQSEAPCVRAVRLTDGHERVLRLDDGDDALAQAAGRALRQDLSQIVAIDGADWFIHVFNPPVHVLIAGAVHIAQSLATMAQAMDWRVTLIDPRTSWANAARFPGVRLIAAWPDEALTALNLNARSAVVTLTHDPKLDDPALAVALKSNAFYIGALGSRKTHASRRERLAGQGFSQSQLDRIHGPVGLDLGALSPAEISVSILAQMVGALRRGAQ